MESIFLTLKQKEVFQYESYAMVYNFTANKNIITKYPFSYKDIKANKWQKSSVQNKTAKQNSSVRTYVAC